MILKKYWQKTFSVLNFIVFINLVKQYEMFDFYLFKPSLLKFSILLKRPLNLLSIRQKI